MSNQPLCVLCYKPNGTNLVLCADCEAWVQASRQRAGMPLRFAKVLCGHEEADD